jgi:uncharacterized RDD family membrane protein YckC
VSQLTITDTRLHIETPEGAELPMDPAGVGVRIAAFLIDLLIRAAIIMVVGTGLEFAGDFGGGIFLMLFFLIEWFYPVYFEVWRKGATPGKKNMGILVVNDDGTPVNFSTSLIRNLLRVIDSFPIIFYMPALVSCLCSKNFKRLGDYAAGTLVIYAQPKHKRPEFDVKGKTAVPTDFNTEEQRALIAFAERSRNLSQDRQKELADVLAPLIYADDRIKTIKQMANSLAGSSDG